MTKKLNITKLNNLNFKNIDKKRFPIISILNYVSKKSSLYETVIVSANDSLVDLFLDGKIKFFFGITTYNNSFKHFISIIKWSYIKYWF